MAIYEIPYPGSYDTGCVGTKPAATVHIEAIDRGQKPKITLSDKIAYVFRIMERLCARDNQPKITLADYVADTRYTPKVGLSTVPSALRLRLLELLP